MDATALVLLSGGQDSTVCLAWALERYARVETVGFDYGQRNAVELDCRRRILDELPRTFPRWAPKLGRAALVELVTEHTHSCYKGERRERHAWGYGCAACPACELRARGYARYMAR